MQSVTKQVTIVNRRGLHARAAAKLVKLAVQFEASIEICRSEQCVPASSILGLITLGAANGTEVSIRATGPDSEKAVATITELVA
ncbi:MAG: HPr family phosphocarrier protein, partial [Pseudomonadota bacterium]